MNMQRIVIVAVISTLAEAILGVIVFGFYTLVHFCGITIHCPKSKIEEWAYIFYTTYVKSKDSCGTGLNSTAEWTTNDNALTSPNNIFILELVILVLNLALAGTVLLLSRFSSDRRNAAPWLLVMLITLIVDLVSSSFALTDYTYEETDVDLVVCDLDPSWSQTRRNLTVTTLFLVFSRGVIIWLLNLFLFIYISYLYFQKTDPIPRTLRTINRNKEDLWMAYPGPQNDLDADDDNFETANQNQGQGIYHVPFHHHQPQLNDQQVQLVQLPRHDGSDGGARRAPSFQERIQKADSNQNPLTNRENHLWSYTNPSAKMELRDRGLNMRNIQPDQDVDTAFDFLENYASRDDVSANQPKKNSVYLSQLLETNIDHIPRARVTNGPSRPQSPTDSVNVNSPQNQNTGPGSRYFVPLKH